MRSYRLEGSGGTECLALHDEPRPEPKPHEIVLRVRATSLNRRDTMILNGTYPLPPRQGVVPLSDGPVTLSPSAIPSPALLSATA